MGKNEKSLPGKTAEAILKKPMILYMTPEGAVKVKLVYDAESFWLPQDGIAQLFGGGKVDDHHSWLISAIQNEDASVGVINFSGRQEMELRETPSFWHTSISGVPRLTLRTRRIFSSSENTLFILSSFVRLMSGTHNIAS